MRGVQGSAWGNLTEEYLSDPVAGTWNSRTRIFRWYTVYFSPYISVLTKEEKWKGTCVISSINYCYDATSPFYPLTDRGTVTQQAAGYGPTRFRANLTRVVPHLASEGRLIQSVAYFYDTVGNVVASVDPLNHWTSTTYAPSNNPTTGTPTYAFPTSVSNAKGQTVQTSHDFNTGLVTAMTDANNQTTSFQYDPYNRVSRVDQPNGAWATREYDDDYFTGQLRTYVRMRKSVDSGGGASEEVNYYDGLGRVLKTEIKEGPSAASFVERQYAACACTGKTAKVSMPYHSGDTVYWTETQYDGLGRIHKVIPPDGSSSSNYTEYRYKVARSYVPAEDCCLGTNQEYGSTRFMVGVFDAKGIGRVQVYDIDGRLREVREDASASDFSSSYVTQYKPLTDPNRLWTNNQWYIRYDMPTIVQGSQTRYQRIDSLGRVTEDQQAESGLTTFTYDDAGRALTKTDSRVW
jgi:YD repeat-containing protein